MDQRRLSRLVGFLVVLMVLAVGWDLLGKLGGGAASAPSTVAGLPDTAAGRAESAAPPPAPPAQTPTPSPGATPDAGGPSYLEQVARAEIRRRIRASAGLTYLNDIIEATGDSVLHRWDGRVSRPVRVYLPTATVANFQPAFLDAVRAAFQRWESAGVPVRFSYTPDSADADVTVTWRIQFDLERTGQTDVEWDQDGHIQKGAVTLSTFDLKGQPLSADDVRVIALHEIGHLIGLDHSPDSTDVMYTEAAVRDLSARDMRTALLLYELAPGSIQ